MFPATLSAKDSWLVLLETIQFARDHFERLVLARAIPKELGEEVIAALLIRLAEYKSLSSSAADVPSVVGIIPATNAETYSIKAFRNWKFLEHEIGQLKSAGKLSLSQFHALEMEVAERLSAISRRLSNTGIHASTLEATCIVQAVVVDDDSAAPPAQQDKGEPLASGSNDPRGERMRRCESPLLGSGAAWGVCNGAAPANGANNATASRANKAFFMAASESIGIYIQVRRPPSAGQAFSRRRRNPAS